MLISDVLNAHTAAHWRDGMSLPEMHWKHRRLTVNCLRSAGMHVTLSVHSLSLSGYLSTTTRRGAKLPKSLTAINSDTLLDLEHAFTLPPLS